MKKKVLFVTNLDTFHENFHLPYIKRLNDCNCDVDIASSGNLNFKYVNNKFDIAFGRTPFDKCNISSYFAIRKVLNTYYDIIYFSTPIVGAIGRIATIGKRCGRIIYAAHGYNFYKGNSWIKNAIFGIVEWSLSLFTDCIFTMNKEDYCTVKKYHFPCKEIYNVDGVGVDTSAFNKCSSKEKHEIRQSYGLKDDDFIMIYPAELTTRKNQQLLFHAVLILSKTHKNIKLLLAGKGQLYDEYNEMIRKMQIDDYVDLLGFRTDVKQLLKASDVLFASSLNEGLPINIIEAMSTGLPIVATSIRGHIDLVQEGVNGYLFNPTDPQCAVEKLKKLINNDELYGRMSLNAYIASKRYDIDNVLPQYDKIWSI